MASLSVIEDVAGVLRATIEVLIGEVVEGIEVPITMGVLAV